MRSVVGKLGKALRITSGTGCGNDCWSKIACAATVPPQLPPVVTYAEDPRLEQLPRSSDGQLYTHLYPWQTRIIKLLPGDPVDSLECELLVADITNAEFGLGVHAVSDVVEYEALSYSWGWPERTATVRCSGVIVDVPPSLATALQYLRSTSDSRMLWCDALCINQEDNEEKSNQVKQMLAIFRKATRIISWLGELDVHIVRILTAAKLYTAKMYHCQCNVDLAISLTRVLQISWFRRTWIRQEMFAGDDINNVYLQSGTETVTFQQLWQTYQTLGNRLIDSPFQDVYHDLEESASTFRVLRSDVDLAHDPRLSARTENWLKVLNNGSGFGVTDERDRVYGIIGMLASTRQYSRHSSRGRLLDFPVDYSRSAHTVYADVIRYLVYLTSNWDCLLVFTHGSARPSKLASWMIDWSLTQPRVVLPSFVTAVQSGNRELGEMYIRDLTTHRLHGIRTPLVMTGRIIGTKILSIVDRQSVQTIQNISKLSDMADFVNGIKSLCESEQYVQMLSQHLVPSNKTIHTSLIRLLAPSSATDGDILVQPVNTVLPLVLRKTGNSTEDWYKIIGPVVFATLVSAEQLAARTATPSNEAWSSDLLETIVPADSDKLVIDRTPKSCMSAPRPMSLFMLDESVRREVEDMMLASLKGHKKREFSRLIQSIREQIGKVPCGHCTQCQIGLDVQTFHLV